MSLFKKNKESKIDISELRKYLVKASKARFLDWEPIGDKVRSPYGEKLYQGYKTRLPSGSSIEMIVRSIDNKMILGLRIKNEREELFLTENSKKLPGKEVTEATDLLLIISWIDAIFKDNSLIGSIESELAGLIYSQ